MWTRSISYDLVSMKRDDCRICIYLDDGADKREILLVLGLWQTITAHDPIELHLRARLHVREGRDVRGEPLLDRSGRLDATDHERTADEDNVDYHDIGKGADWVFSPEGECWQACQSSKGAPTTSPTGANGIGSAKSGGKTTMGGASLFRDFSWGGKEAQERRIGGGAKLERPGIRDEISRRSSCV